MTCSSDPPSDWNCREAPATRSPRLRWAEDPGSCLLETRRDPRHPLDSRSHATAGRPRGCCPEPTVTLSPRRPRWEVADAHACIRARRMLKAVAGPGDRRRVLLSGCSSRATTVEVAAPSGGWSSLRRCASGRSRLVLSDRVELDCRFPFGRGTFTARTDDRWNADMSRSVSLGSRGERRGLVLLELATQ